MHLTQRSQQRPGGAPVEEVGQGAREQVARELGITQKTVHNHLNAIYRRLDTQSLTHAVLSAVRLGIIDLHEA